MRQTIAILLVGLSFSSLAAEAPRCLTYGANVQLSGLLKEQSYPDPVGGKPLQYFVLALPAPVCVNAPAGSAEYVSVSSAKIIQLVLTPSQYDSLRPLINHQAKLRGKLFSPFTGRHFEPLLMDDVSLAVDER